MIRQMVLAVAIAFGACPALAQSYHREELRLPMAAAGPKGLEALLVRPETPGRYPLVIISHGSPRKPEDAKKMTPAGLYANAVEFARRGFAAAIVMRRGYGESGGDYAERMHSCRDPDYIAAGRASAQDIKAAIAALSQRSDIDATHVVAVGVSAGGFGTVALTADPPPGLAAAISFAGGRGSRADFDVCNEGRLADAFGAFGKNSRVPMLWVYAENDHYFAPPLAEKFRTAFAAGGGRVEFIRAPAFGQDGHRLFSAAGIQQWTPYVDAFLARHNLAQRDIPAPPPALPALKAPSQLSANGRDAFDKYLRAAPHKAFAVSSDGHFGWRTGQRSADEAKDGALKFCGATERDCRVVFVDDAAAP